MEPATISTSHMRTSLPPRRFHEATQVDDRAAACVFLLNLSKDVYAANTQPMPSHINVGTGAMSRLSTLRRLWRGSGFEGRISSDTTKPDGAPRKPLDVSRLTDIGSQASTALKQSIRQTDDWYLASQNRLRGA